MDTQIPENAAETLNLLTKFFSFCKKKFYKYGKKTVYNYSFYSSLVSVDMSLRSRMVKKDFYEFAVEDMIVVENKEGSGELLKELIVDIKDIAPFSDYENISLISDFENPGVNLNIYQINNGDSNIYEKNFTINIKDNYYNRETKKKNDKLLSEDELNNIIISKKTESDSYLKSGQVKKICTIDLSSLIKKRKEEDAFNSKILKNNNYAYGVEIEIKDDRDKIYFNLGLTYYSDMDKFGFQLGSRPVQIIKIFDDPKIGKESIIFNPLSIEKDEQKLLPIVFVPKKSVIIKYKISIVTTNNLKLLNKNCLDEEIVNIGIPIYDPGCLDIVSFPNSLAKYLKDNNMEQADFEDLKAFKYDRNTVMKKYGLLNESYMKFTF